MTDKPETTGTTGILGVNITDVQPPKQSHLGIIHRNLNVYSDCRAGMSGHCCVAALKSGRNHLTRWQMQEAAETVQS